MHTVPDDRLLCILVQTRRRRSAVELRLSTLLCHTICVICGLPLAVRLSTDTERSGARFSARGSWRTDRKQRKESLPKQSQFPTSLSVMYNGTYNLLHYIRACKGEQFIGTECSILPSHADSDLDLAFLLWMPLNSDLAERDESFPSDSYPELLLFTQASWVETLGWRACGNNSLQVLAAIWKLWCRKKNRVTSLSSKVSLSTPQSKCSSDPI